MSTKTARPESVASAEGGPGRRQHDATTVNVLNAFTVDVEDYFQVSGFEQSIRRSQWDRYECRVVANTRRLLRMLDRHQVRATFFVLGWVAHRYPELVREIHKAGHEIGSHSYWHRLIYDQTPEEFCSDLRRSCTAIKEAIGRRITAYRAPSFSITRRSLWALEILSREGFQVDASIFPAFHDRYGIPHAPRQIHRIATRAGTLWEFPPAVATLGGLSIPVAGGGYFRLFPLSWTLFCLARINRTTGSPFIFYVHPWEIDPDQPRLRAGSRMSRLRHYVNLRRTEGKLEALLCRFRFGRLSDVIDTLSRETTGRPRVVNDPSPSAVSPAGSGGCSMSLHTASSETEQLP